MFRIARPSRILAASGALAAALGAAPQYVAAQEAATATTSALEVLGPTPIVNALTETIREARAGYVAEGRSWTFADQQAVVERYVFLAPAVVSSEPPADPVARLSLGEFYFRTFRGDIARDHFLVLAKRDDLIGQLATDRILTMAFASGNADALDSLDQFERKFAPSAWNVHRSRNSFLFLLGRSEGDAARSAGQRLLESVEALPADAPYSLFAVPVQNTDVLTEHGLLEEARRLVGAKLTGLRLLESDWAAAAPAAASDPVLTSDMPQWYWRDEGIQAGETFHGARLRQLRDLIEQLEQWLA